MFPSSAVANNALLVAFFPAGNVDSPSNLTAASGTVMGNDTNALQWYGPPLVPPKPFHGVLIRYAGQIAWGPASTGPFAVYNTPGPVVAARQGLFNDRRTNRQRVDDKLQVVTCGP